MSTLGVVEWDKTIQGEKSVFGEDDPNDKKSLHGDALAIAQRPQDWLRQHKKQLFPLRPQLPSKGFDQGTAERVRGRRNSVKGGPHPSSHLGVDPSNGCRHTWNSFRTSCFLLMP